MTEPITQNIQDYLKEIYNLTTSGEDASTTALATRLGITPASVTGMLQKLAILQPPLILYQKHLGARLTETGEKAALEVLRHHRLLEVFLVESLGYSWDAVHEEACKLEHVISEEFEARIARQLGHPLRDPHGAPIPSEELVMPFLNDIPLSNLQVGEKAIVRRVECKDASLLRHLQDLGLVPGVKLTVSAYSPNDANLTVRVADRPAIVIPPTVCRHVNVEIIHK